MKTDGKWGGLDEEKVFEIKIKIWEGRGKLVRRAEIIVLKLELRGEGNKKCCDFGGVK